MIYLGIGDMPIYNFDKVLKTNNLSYMVVGWNEREEITPPEEALKRWNEIYNEYCEKTANNDALNYYSLTSEIGYLEMRYFIIYNLINGLNNFNKESFGREINAWKIPFNIKGEIEPQLETLQRHLRIAEQNINIKKRKLEALKVEEGESSSLIEQIILIQEHLGVKIDMLKDSVEYFLTAMKRLKNKIEQQKKARNG